MLCKSCSCQNTLGSLGHSGNIHKALEFVVQKVFVKIMHKTCFCIEAIVKERKSLKFDIIKNDS
jgi:hypothetical protein